MGWKNWPYWAKGGIWVIAISIFFDIIAGGCFLLIRGESGMLCLIPMVHIGIFNLLIKEILQNETGNVFTFTLSIILSLAVLFIIGAVIGWIYGKIKQKKNA